MRRSSRWRCCRRAPTSPAPPSAPSPRCRARREDPETDEEPGKIVHEWVAASPGAPAPRRLAGARRRAPLLRLGGLDLMVPGAARFARRALARERAGGELGERRVDVLERALEDGDGLVPYGTRLAPGGLARTGLARRGGSHRSGPSRRRHLEAQRGRSRSRRLPTRTRRLSRWWHCEPSLRSRARSAGDERRRGWPPRSRRPSIPTRSRSRAAVRRWRGPVPSWAGCCGRTCCSTGARDRAAERLCQPDVLTPWGLRTLSSDHPLFAPDAYHRGAVWPFDTWLGWSGLRAAGRGADGRAASPGSPGCDRVDRPDAGAVRRGVPMVRSQFVNRKPRTGLDRGSSLGARARMGWPFGVDLSGAPVDTEPFHSSRGRSSPRSTLRLRGTGGSNRAWIGAWNG